MAQLRDICAQCLPSDHDMSIIDVLESPELAEEGRVLATPTLVRISPPPERRIVGDLSDQRIVLQALDIGCDHGGSSGTLKR